jgi:histidinol-phosphate aminotransferase
MTWVTKLARPEIVNLVPYEHAVWAPTFTRLHANEFPWRSPGDQSGKGLNQYPEPQPKSLIGRLAELYHVTAESILVGRGSDESIDLLVRSFCRAAEDSVLICPPTFGFYSVAARIQGAKVVEVPLRAQDGFSLDPDAVLRQIEPTVKLVFLCSPNNPTGNLLNENSLLFLADALHERALIVVDEAYIEFADRKSLAPLVAQRPQLVVLRTLSKAYGLAGARVGALIAHPEVVALLQKVIAPYAITQLTLEAALPVISGPHLRTQTKRIGDLRVERARFASALARLPGVLEVLPSDANFLLVRFADPARALERAREERLLVRDARNYLGLSDALRITVGTPESNNRLLEAWQS